MTRSLECPSCGREMVEEVTHGVTIDRCGGCRGLWLDRFEVEAFLRGEMGDRPGRPPTEERFGAATRADDARPTAGGCPRCGAGSLRRGELRGAAYRICPECRGVFLAEVDVARIVAGPAGGRPREPGAEQLVDGVFIALDFVQSVPADTLAEGAKAAASALAEGAEAAASGVELVFEFVGDVLSSW